jgi:hypothetical protein
MTTVPTLHLQERPAGGEPSVWIRGTIDRRWALELFTHLVHADSLIERRFGPDTGHRLVLLADGPGELHPDNDRPVVRSLVDELAVDVERGATALEADALTGWVRDHADVSARKLAAAEDLRAYAAQLRAATGEVSAVEARLMARAGRYGGILIDGASKKTEERAALQALVAQGHMVHVTDQGSVRFWALASYGGWYGRRVTRECAR